MLLSEILQILNGLAPFSLQEDYDNSGLIIGIPGNQVNKALICVDVTEENMQEAIDQQCDLIISHHPLIFSGLKRITGQNLTERLVASAIRNNISIVALHTNLDNHPEGVNKILSGKLGLINQKILRPVQGMLRKLVTFCPHSHAEALRSALFAAGAGHIGNYDSCSFSQPGKGTFRALPGSNPFVGKQDELHIEPEERIEVIFASYLERTIISALKSAHPYEEVAYDIYELKNEMPDAGAGMIGELPSPMNPADFLETVKNVVGIPLIRHTGFHKTLVSKIAICGGSGSFLIKDAIAANADVYLTGDIKYHDFFIPENRIILADIGHYESEQFTKELIFTLLNKKIPTFALLISGISSNPVNYL